MENEQAKTTALALPSYREAMADADAYKRATSQWQDVISSGWLPSHIKNPKQAMAIVEHGRSMGLDAWESIGALQLVQGNPTVKANKLRALIEKRHPGKMAVIKSDSSACVIRVAQDDPVSGETIPVDVSFTIEDAREAGLTSGKNPNWKKYPADMLFARCITRVEKRFLPIGSGAVWVAELVDDHAKQNAKQPRTLGDL